MYVVSNMLAKAWVHACGLRTAATTMCCGTNWFTIGDARPPPISAILLLQAAHARNNPPWWIKRRKGPRGQRGRAAGAWGWLVGLADGWWQGGRGLGLAGGSGGMGHGGMGAWKGMIGFDIYYTV